MANRYLEVLGHVAFLFSLILGIIAIYQILRRLFGGSWSVEGVILALVGIIGAGIIYLIGETMKNGKDIGAIKGELVAIRTDIRHIRRDVERLDKRFDAGLPKQHS